MAYAITLPPTIPYKFFGDWQRKYWKNIPGPFYSTTYNMMSLLACYNDLEHHFLLYDDDCEFVWQQPSTPKDIKACLQAMNCDEVGSYQIDGNLHWTPLLVREWWKRRDELLDWAQNLLLRPIHDALQFWNGVKNATDLSVVNEYIRFLNEDANEYLRSYIFLLENGKAATPLTVLPDL